MILLFSEWNILRGVLGFWGSVAHFINTQHRVHKHLDITMAFPLPEVVSNIQRSFLAFYKRKLSETLILRNEFVISRHET